MNNELKQYLTMILASLSVLAFLSIAAWFNYEREGFVVFLLVSVMACVYFYFKKYRT